MRGDWETIAPEASEWAISPICKAASSDPTNHSSPTPGGKRTSRPAQATPSVATATDGIQFCPPTPKLAGLIHREHASGGVVVGDDVGIGLRRAVDDVATGRVFNRRRHEQHPDRVAALVLTVVTTTTEREVQWDHLRCRAAVSRRVRSVP